MRRSCRTGGLIAAISLAFAGCQDSPSRQRFELPTQAGSDVDLQANLLSGVQGGSVHNDRPRIGAEIALTGSLRPETYLVVTVTAKANEETFGGVLRVTLPEVEAVRFADQGRPPLYPLGVAVPAAGEWRLGGMSKGAQVVRPVAVSFPTEGYYRICVTTHAQGPGDIDVGRYLFDDGYVEVWVLVTNAGGKVTRVFEPALLPNDVVRQPGPFVRKSSTRPQEASIVALLRPLASLVKLAVQSSDSVYLQARYYDGTQYRPAVGATLYARMYDPRNRVYLGPQESKTVPANGIVSLWCPSSFEWHVQINLGATSYTLGRSNIGGTIATGYSCGMTIPVYPDGVLYQIWKTLNDVIPGVTVHLGYSRSQVPWGYNPNSAGSYYDPNSDYIILGTAGFNNPWTAAHEYGHALHHKALGGLWSATNCNPHYISQPSSYSCAFLEGFADYLGDVGRDGDPSDWENFHVTNRPAEVEGNIAALFLDLIDSANEAGDNTSYSPFYVATVFKTCRVYVGLWLNRNDVSDFVWCLENRIDRNLHQQRFPGVSAASSVNENAAEPPPWNSDHVRTTWLKNAG